MPPLTLFLSEDSTRLLHNKFVVIIGDSIQRGIYKDLIALLQGNEYLSSQDLKSKGEHDFMNDTLLEGGKFGRMHNGINYREVRQYRTDFHLVRYYFVTRVNNKYWEDVIFPDLKGDPTPDVLIMNSCLWDISRYEQRRGTCMDTFKRNIETTFSQLNSILPMETLIVWNTALPVAQKIKGGFMLPELEYLSETIRLDVLEANFYAKELAKCYDIDILDLHFFFRHQMHRQVGDGVHWNYVAHRRITNLVLAHIGVAWGVGCPRGRVPATPDRHPRVSESQPSNIYYDFEAVDAKEKKGVLEPTTEESSSLPDDERGKYSGSNRDGSVTSADSREDGGGDTVKLTRPADAASMPSLLRDAVYGSMGRRPPSPQVDKKVKSAEDGPSQEESGGRKSLLTDRPPSRSGNRDRPPSRSSSHDRPNRPSSRDRPPSRSSSRGSSPSRSRPETPILKGGGLPSSIDFKPIDVGDVQETSSGPILGSPLRLKERGPRAGSRFQPYINPNSQSQYESYPQQTPRLLNPPQPRPNLCVPQPNAMMPQPYSQPVYPYHLNVQSLPYQQPMNSYNQYNGYQPYGGVNNNQVGRMRQRMNAERSMEIVRGLLMEDVFRLQ